jgi:dTDP-4-amino-4,6-dideoxygalactose transaminase
MKYPLFKVHVDIPKALEEIEKVLESGFINEGEQVTQFLKGISEWVNGEPVLMNACTSALATALHLLDLKEGDEIVTTSMTCVATNTPIANSPAKIVWADINPRTGTLDPKSVEEAITEKTKAVMCMNWGGYPCDLQALRDICDKHNIKLIQDAAHSFGASFEGDYIDHYADYTCFSFQAIKHLTTGDGGMLICKSEDDAKRARALKWFGIDRDATKDEQGSWKGQAWDFDIYDPGFKYNMNNLSAAIGLTQLPKIESLLDVHEKNAELYNELLDESVGKLMYPEEAMPSCWIHTIFVSSEKRDDIIQKLNDDGIQAGLVHVPNHYYSCFKDVYKELPGTDEFYKTQISLPCGWWLEEKDIKFIAEKVNEYVLS